MGFYARPMKAAWRPAASRASHDRYGREQDGARFDRDRSSAGLFAVEGPRGSQRALTRTHARGNTALRSLVDYATLHHERYVFDRRDVPGRVALDRDDVGVEAGA